MVVITRLYNFPTTFEIENGGEFFLPFNPFSSAHLKQPCVLPMAKRNVQTTYFLLLGPSGSEEEANVQEIHIPRSRP